ncbi:TPA: HD domain-containing protein [Legionella pneumophila]|nr:HD domain-containing protein [Legionella pneumophila]HAT8183516.1 HD domain-containing protein [Legionella pneumophila]
MLTIHPEKTIYFHNIISAMSYALDLTEGQPPGHSLRSCWIGMHIGQYLNLSEQQQHDLYYTLLLKDAGCSSNAARLCELYGSDDRVVKNAYKVVDSQDKKLLAKFVFKFCGLDGSNLNKMKHIMKIILSGGQITSELITARCDRGASIARQLGLNEEVAQGIYSLDEHYNGKGKPSCLKEEEIPLYSRIALLSQVVDVFYKVSGKEICCNQVNKRSGSWFDPILVNYFNELKKNEQFWFGLTTNNLEEHLTRFQPKSMTLPLTYEILDNVAETFGQIVDAKSPFTAGHSKRVAHYAIKIAEYLNIKHDSRRVLYPAALLHDIGKLGVGNNILDKPGALEENEWQIIKKHPQYTEEILSRFLPFHSLAEIAAAHHERIDGKGYFKGKKGDEIAPETRIITIADIFDALTADRPYRGALPISEALKIMDKLRNDALDNDYMDALHEIIKNEGVTSPEPPC